MNPRSKTFDDNLIQIIIQNSSSCCVIGGNQCFVIAVVFITVQISDFGTVSGIMQENGITRSTLSDNSSIGIQNGCFGRWWMVTIIYKGDNIFVLKAIVVLYVVVLYT